MKRIINTVVITSILLAIICLVVSKMNSYSEFYKAATYQEISERLNNDEKLIVYIYKDSCSKCIYIKEKLEKKELNARIYGLNLDKELPINFLEKYNISFTPTFLKFNRKKLVNKLDDIKDVNDVISFVRDD